MKACIKGICAAAALAFGAAAWGQATAPAGAPAGTTGQCKDGTWYSGATKKGACKGHKGVKEWYGTAEAGKKEPAKTAAPAEPAASSASAGAAAPSTAPAASPAPTAASTKSKPSSGAKQPAPGGGPGLVWVNTSTKVYHCQGDKYYGTTKAGEYMSEADAKAKGNRAAGGKACS